MAFYKAPTTNFWSTTLNGLIDASVTTITLNSVTGLQAPGVLIIDRENVNQEATPTLRELVAFTGISSNDITGVTRGFDGSTGKAHLNGALVESVPAVGLWNGLRDAVAAALTTDGSGIALSGTASIATLIVQDIPKVAITSIASIARLQTPNAQITSAQITSTVISNVTISNSLNASGASITGLFPSAASGAFLQSRGNETTPAYTTVPGLQSKIITSTRNATTASGDVSYTGIGFVPTSIQIQATLGDDIFIYSFGISDSSKAGISYYNIGTSFSGLANTVGLTNAVIFVGANNLNWQGAIVKTYDADGVTLTWTKTGSPTGTIRINIIAYK